MYYVCTHISPLWFSGLVLELPAMSTGEHYTLEKKLGVGAFGASTEGGYVVGALGAPTWLGRGKTRGKLMENGPKMMIEATNIITHRF